MIARRMIKFPSTEWHRAFNEMDRMARHMDLLTHGVLWRPTRRWMHARAFPALNITENGDKYVVRAELPGMKAEDIDIQVKDRRLTISGERRIPSGGENVKYHRREREAGKFARTIELPGQIDSDHVDAKLVNGLLMVTLSKPETAKPKQITVN
ncbi:MAG: Hsp20/alpha crystallin family protein [Desulfobacterales bacterium]|jgi:HSP20 family protein